jgi:2-C-methyl-D-erythritol 4-phosphate cytidylyltransferase
VVVVEGDPNNLKVTGPADLERAEALLERRAL